jgi:hypothetical protein
MVLDMALSQEDRANGYGLMCMAKPLSPSLDIEFGTIDALQKLFPPREFVPFVLTDKILRTPTMVELQLRPLGENLRFWPGQYVMLGDERAGAPLRSYSIANARAPTARSSCYHQGRGRPDVGMGPRHPWRSVTNCCCTGPMARLSATPRSRPGAVPGVRVGLAPILGLADGRCAVASNGARP